MAFVVIPEGRLWNGRLLPFYYLTVMLLAALAVAEASALMQLVDGRRRRTPGAGVRYGARVLAVVLVVVGLPLGQLPFGTGSNDRQPPAIAGRASARGDRRARQLRPSWAKWNYTGYEGKDSYREYYDVVRTMAQVGEDRAAAAGPSGSTRRSSTATARRWR